MAAVDAFDGSLILIKVGDGATPTEIFTADCLINADRDFSIDAETSQTLIPDCANPTAPAWSKTVKKGLSVTINGAGILHKTDIAAYDAWVMAEATKNIQLEVGGPGGRKYSGAFHLTKFSVTGTPLEEATCSITLVSDGVVTAATLP